MTLKAWILKGVRLCIEFYNVNCMESLRRETQWTAVAAAEHGAAPWRGWWLEFYICMCRSENYSESNKLRSASLISSLMIRWDIRSAPTEVIEADIYEQNTNFPSFPACRSHLQPRCLLCFVHLLFCICRSPELLFCLSFSAFSLCVLWSFKFCVIVLLLLQEKCKRLAYNK